MPPSTPPPRGPDAATDKVRLPDMRPTEGETDDAFAERFAEAMIAGIDRWLAAHGHPPLADDDGDESHDPAH